MATRNLRGAYLCLEHDRAADWEWLAKWQPNVIRYMGQGSISDPNSFDVNRVRRIHETCPTATILLRCWDVDDNNFTAHQAMVANPRAEAERQVDWWAKVFDRANTAGVPRALLMAGLNNETGPEKDAALYPYTEHALMLGTRKGVRLGIFVFSVGRPALPGEAEYTIDTFSRLDAAILANKGAIILHEYMQPEGMYAVWTDNTGNQRKDYTYLIGRHARWDVQSPIIIGEWGIDGILYNRHPDPKYGNSGWRNFKAEWPPNRYADEYVECIRQASDNVIGICPFLSDFSDHKWQSFDLLDAYGEFLARKDLCVKEISDTQPDTSPETIHLPSVPNESAPTEQPQPANAIGYVIAKAGANLRQSPTTDSPIIRAIEYGETIRITAVASVEGWVRVRYGRDEGWIASQLIGLTPPEKPAEPEPEPTVPLPTGIINPLTALAFMQVESGNRAFEGGFLVIRFEVHRFKANLKNDALFDKHFKFTPGNYSEQYWRRDPGSPWIHAHGNQHERHTLLAFAEKLNQKAAYLSIGMGMAQIMGENHARVGYSNPFVMFVAFSHPRYGVNAQVMGFVNYVLSDPALFEALRQRDWFKAVQKYNGIGQESIYIPALEKALQEIQQEVGG